MEKVIELRTIEDMLNVVNCKNIANFLKDFNQYLELTVLARELNKEMGMKIPTEPVLKWIDDGKNDVSINIEIVNK